MSGSYSGVVGLPLAEVADLLNGVGFEWRDTTGTSEENGAECAEDVRG